MSTQDATDDSGFEDANKNDNHNRTLSNRSPLKKRGPAKMNDLE